MIEFIFLSLIKIADNIISTFKSITVYQEKRILSSILVVISQLIFYLLINKIIEDNTMLTIIIVSVSSGIGNWIAFVINDKFKRAAKWVFVLTSSDKDDVIRLCEYLTTHDIKHIANHGLTRKGDETIHVMAFSKTKDDSRLIDTYLENTNSKYLKEII